jgi:hypothetical protein
MLIHMGHQGLYLSDIQVSNNEDNLTHTNDDFFA